MSSDLPQATPGLRIGLAPWARPSWRLVLDWVLGNARAGSLTMLLPSGERIDFHGTDAGPRAHMTLHRWSALGRLLRGGHLGFAEGYMAGDFETANLTELLRWAMANEAAISSLWNGSALARALAWLAHLRRSNSRIGSRRNISAHYDLGNEFYLAWLDAGMNYSAALYANPGQTLETAQIVKNDRVLSLLGAEPSSTVLEIGCGWGALAERLIERTGCHVTGITLSHEQLAYAAARLDGAQPQPDIRLEDYRDLATSFDRIVSIEMIEAVGERYWPAYFATLKRCLNPGGIAVLQAITIAETRYAAYRRYPDFIQKHIFPGGMLPTKTILAEQMRRANLTLLHAEHFGGSYGRTIEAWRERFVAAWPQLQRLGFDDTFRRKWEYYFAYCQTGFELGLLDVGLYQLQAA